MGLRKKVAILSFVLSGNFESLTLTGFEPATMLIAVGDLTHYAKFPEQKRVHELAIFPFFDQN